MLNFDLRGRGLTLSLPLILALAGIPHQTSAFYRMPAKAEISAEDLAKSCAELEREIAEQVPLTYSYRPGFYEDPYQGVSMVVGTTISPVAYAFSAVGIIGSLADRARIEPAEERIAVLRHLKADKHCFERDSGRFN